MSKTCCACCDCDCCIGKINDNLDYLTEATQILPQRHNNLSINTTYGRKEELSQENNALISFGGITYGHTLNLNELTKLNNCKLNVKCISFTDSHSLMLIERVENNSNTIQESMVYGYGSNENGQLGIDYDPKSLNNYYHAWTQVPLHYIGEPNTIIQKRLATNVYGVHCGDKFSILTTILADGSLALYRFMLRKDDKFSLLNGGVEAEQKKRCIFIEKFNSLHNGGVLKVAVFGDRILVLTHKNFLYVRGILYDMGNAGDYVLYKKFNLNNDKIVSLNAGINNCLLLSSRNIIYAIGHNDYCEFGIKDEELPKCVSQLDFQPNEYLKHGEIFENRFFFNNGLKVKKISSGARHSLVLCDDGKVYCFGDNSDSQCCGLEKIVSTPTLVRFNDYNEVIVDIKAGFNHSIAKGTTGKIYVWGDSAWDKLGFKETRVDQNEPVEISDLKIRNVHRIFAGPTQTAFFISGGKVPV
jgi:alpha-tubulin suppressor-like RCC1 family protein